MSQSVLGWKTQSSPLALSTTSRRNYEIELATVPSPPGYLKNKDCQAMDGKIIRASLDR